MADKILFQNKEKLIDNTSIPDKNKVTANDMNEIKEVVNAHADDIDELDEVKANRTEIPTDLSELSNETTKFVNETQLSEAIESEESSRELADENLQGQIDSINDDISALDDRVEANEDDIADINLEQTVQDNEIGALKLDSGHTIELSINTTNYELSAKLKNKSGTVLNTSTIDLPLESMIINVEYDNANKQLIITLQNGNKIYVPIADIIGGLQSEITPENMLSSDLVDDNNHAHKFMSISEKTKLESIETGAEVNVIEVIKVDGTAITVTEKTVNVDLSAKEDKSNKVTSLSSSSTDTQYPSAKCVYDSQVEQDNEISVLRNLAETELEDTTATGTSITVNDSANAPAKLLPSGNTFQKQLPNEYQAVDYIQFSKTQYIDTGIIPSNDIGFKVIATPIHQSGDSMVIGSSGGNNTTYFIYLPTSGKYFAIGWGTNKLYSSYAINNNSEYKVLLNYKNDRKLIINDSTLENDLSAITEDNTFNLYIGSNHNANGTSSLYQGLISFIQITRGTKVIAEFVPCYRISDNVVGMYDLVNNVFYTNQGTGTLTYGSTIPNMPNPNNQQDIQNISGNNSIIIANSDNTKTQNLPFTLPEGMEMCKIDTYQDEFIKQNGKWYKTKNIDKITLNGTENWQRQSSLHTTVLNLYIQNVEWGQGRSGKVFCTIAQNSGAGGSNDTNINRCNFNSTFKNFLLDLSLEDFSDLSSFTTWLQTNNIIVYFVLANPVLEEITDATLIEQLDAMQKIISYFEQTNVNTISAGDLEAILNLDYKKSNRLRIDALEQAIISLGGNI